MPFKGSLADAADLKALAELREGPAYDKGLGYKQSAGPTQIVLPPQVRTAPFMMLVVVHLVFYKYRLLCWF